MVWLKPVRENLCDTIKRYFQKCGFSIDDYVATTQDSEEEFKMLFNKMWEKCSIDEYVEADKTLATPEEADVSKRNWREKLQGECIEEVLKV